MIGAILALTILNTLFLIVLGAGVFEVIREQKWDRLTLIPWINALNTKLGLPK